jgi:hypothetical protein
MARETLQLVYGSYYHAPGECELSFKRYALTGDSKNPYAERIDVDITGTLVGTGVADINAQMSQLIQAYAYNGRDFRVIDSNGANHRLSIISSATNGGIMVTIPPSFPTNKNAAGVTYMIYQIQLQAEIPVTSPATVLDKFEEQLTFSGGGPVVEYLETRVGLPQKQIPTLHTIYRATQEGSAIGYYTTPLVPRPIWPSLMTKAPVINKQGGRLVGSGNARQYMFKGVRWQYTYASAFPMFGTPNNWGAQ